MFLVDFFYQQITHLLSNHTRYKTRIQLFQNFKTIQKDKYFNDIVSFDNNNINL